MIVNVGAFFQANLEQHGGGQPFLALRVFAGSPPGPQGPDRADLLVALGLHKDGALAFGGPLFDIGHDDDDSDSDSGMSIDNKEEDDDGDDTMNDDVDDDGDDTMNDDVDDDGDDAMNDDDVQIVYELIHLD